MMDDKFLSPKGLFHELNKLMDSFLSNPFLDFTKLDMIRFNTIETETTYIIEAELPRYLAQNINIRASGSAVQIRAFKTVVQDVYNEQDEHRLISENQEHMERSILLPIAVDHKPITAVFRNNLLEVFVEKEGFVPVTLPSIPIQSE
jgi:HSP20 family molecular chaperone IbpA